MLDLHFPLQYISLETCPYVIILSESVASLQFFDLAGAARPEWSSMELSLNADEVLTSIVKNIFAYLESHYK